MVHLEYFTAPLSERQCGEWVIANRMMMAWGFPAARRKEAQTPL